MRVYTRIGDDGLTYVPLFKGIRVPKDHVVLEVIGSIDELNSLIGLIRSYLCRLKELAKVCSFLRTIQIKLFHVGFELVGSRRDLIREDDIRDMERAIDELSKYVNINVFVLPTGHMAASLLHVARSVCRRLERRLVKLRRDFPDIVSSEVLKYVNRLSDYLYVAALYTNRVMGVEEEKLSLE